MSFESKVSPSSVLADSEPVIKSEILLDVMSLSSVATPTSENSAMAGSSLLKSIDRSEVPNLLRRRGPGKSSAVSNSGQNSEPKRTVLKTSGQDTSDTLKVEVSEKTSAAAVDTMEAVVDDTEVVGMIDADDVLIVDDTAAKDTPNSDLTPDGDVLMADVDCTAVMSDGIVDNDTDPVASVSAMEPGVGAIFGDDLVVEGNSNDSVAAESSAIVSVSDKDLNSSKSPKLMSDVTDAEAAGIDNKNQFEVFTDSEDEAEFRYK